MCVVRLNLPSPGVGAAFSPSPPLPHQPSRWNALWPGAGEAPAVGITGTEEWRRPDKDTEDK